MKKDDILVFQDENANYCFIVGTSDPEKAEKALRRTEKSWFGPVEERDLNSEIEKPLDFSKFEPTTLYIRGDKITWDKNELQGQGRIAVREGFIASLS